MSKLTVAKNMITSKAGRSLLKTQKHSPVLLFGAGLIGFAATVVLASKATLKLEDVLDGHEQDVAEIQDMAKHPKKDLARQRVVLYKDLTKLYAPAIGVGVISVCALGGSHVILTKRNAGLMAAYAALDKAFIEYRGRVRDEFGAEKDRDLRGGVETKQIAVETENGTEVQTLNRAAGAMSQYARLFGPDSSRYWDRHAEYNLAWIRGQQQMANDLLHARGHVFLNEIYDGLGFERTPAGAVVGWVKNNKNGGDNYVDFGIFTDEKRDQFHDFMTSDDGALWLDFNVDGTVFDLI